jgi:hypothetical protein
MPADTGYYVCNISLNGGCIKRRYFFHLNGRCADILPVSVESFKGKYEAKKVLLKWQMAPGLNLKKFVIERKNYSGAYEEIGIVLPSPANDSYVFWDSTYTVDKNFYRLKLINYNNATAYSNIVMVSRKSASDEIRIYPNPAMDNITIEFKNAICSNYTIKIMNLLNQVVKEVEYDGKSGNILQISRSAAMRSGIYILQVLDKKNSFVFSQKIIFQ